MSLLSDRDLLSAYRAQRVVISPWNSAQLQPASYDVRLDRHFRVLEYRAGMAVDPRVELPTELLTVAEDEPFSLEPGEFVLGSTAEHLQLGSYHAGRLEGKSSLGRLGLLTHATAGFIDPGFQGHVTLELVNVGRRPLLLWPGMAIAQLAFFDVSSAVSRRYGEGGNHYQGQRGPTASRAHLQFELPG